MGVSIGTRRYPEKAVLAVAAAGLLFAFNVVTGFLFIALMLPLIPVFIGIMVGSASLLTTALEYAGRVSRRVPTAMLPVGKHDQGVAQRSLAARAS